MAKQKTRNAEIVEIGKVKMDGLGFPAEAVKLPLGKARHGFVFTVTEAQRTKMGMQQFLQVAQNLGDLVYPSRAVLVVMPDEFPDIRAFEVKTT